MPTYYVASTELDKTAEIEAPTPRKARTILLDYLERGNEIDRDQRQFLRETMATKRVRPGSTGADINLDYDMRETTVPTRPVFEEFDDFEEEEEERVTVAPRTMPQSSPAGAATELPPSMSEPRIHRPELYETRDLIRRTPTVATRPVQTSFTQRQATPSSALAERYTPQREAAAMAGSPIAQVSRTAFATRRGL